MIHNVKTGKPRGYAFIEYEHERDMHCEYPLPWTPTPAQLIDWGRERVEIGGFVLSDVSLGGDFKLIWSKCDRSLGSFLFILMSVEIVVYRYLCPSLVQCFLIGVPPLFHVSFWRSSVSLAFLLSSLSLSGVSVLTLNISTCIGFIYNSLIST